MRGILLAFLFFATQLVSSQVDTYVEVNLKDGSVIKGSFLKKNIKIRIPSSTIEVLFENINSIKFNQDKAKISFKNDDILTGILSADSFKINTTSLGQLTLKSQNIQSIKFKTYLIASYPLEGTTIDKCSYENHGLEQGNIIVNQDRSKSKAYVFDGMDDYIEASGQAMNEIKNNDFTFEALIKGDKNLQNMHPPIFSNRANTMIGTLFFLHSKWGDSNYKMLAVQLNGENYFLINNGIPSWYPQIGHNIKRYLLPI